MSAVEQLYLVKETLIMLRLAADQELKSSYTKVLVDIQNLIFQIELERDGLNEL